MIRAAFVSVTLFLVFALGVAWLRRAWRDQTGGSETSLWRRRLRAILLCCLFVTAFLAGGRWLVFPCGWEGCDLEQEMVDERQRPTAYDRRGRFLGVLEPSHGRYVPLDSLAPGVSDVFVAAEDHRFWSHNGVDLRGILRAAYQNVFHGRKQGASTIAMQVAQALSLRLPPDGTWRGKFAETSVAWNLVRQFGKTRVLETYLNTVYVGRNGYGIDAAAERYFGKQAEQLRIAEAALVAALLRNPRRYDPEQLTRQEIRVEVLHVLRTAAETFPDRARIFRSAMDQLPLQFESGESQRTLAVGCYLDAVRAEARTSWDRDTVLTSLDLDLQWAAVREASWLLRNIERDRFGPYRVGDSDSALQAVFVALDARSGEVLAYLCGRPNEPVRYDRVMDARIIPSSTLKPLLYALALETGVVRPWETLGTLERRAGSIHERAPWAEDLREPEHLDLSIVEGLTVSNNKLAVDLLELMPPGSYGPFRRLGLPLPRSGKPADALGTRTVGPLTLVSAYASLANGGHQVTPHLLRDSSGTATRASSEYGPSKRRIWRKRTGDQVMAVLRSVVREGTARHAVEFVDGRFRMAGKTGTAEGHRELAFVGVTGNIVALLWVGHDRPRTIVPDVSAGRIVAPAWARIIQRYLGVRSAGDRTHGSPAAAISRAGRSMVGASRIVGTP